MTTDGADANDGRAEPGLAAQERAALIAAHERRVDAVRNSAQYRVGETVIAAARSPRRLLRLPLDLWRLRKELLAKYRVTAPPPDSAPAARAVTVASVLDEFSHRALAPEWDQRPLSPGRAAAQLASIAPQLVLVESAWEGNGGAFRYELSHLPDRDPSVIGELVDAARRAGIPSVLWNKEDPVHFDTFAPAARLFDWVFTSDADCVARYRDLVGHARVGVMPFAAQPRLHNPRGWTAIPVAKACFAGSWGADIHPERGADVELLLRPAIDAGILDIFDRKAASGANGSSFPPPYAAAVKGHKPYDELLAEYRRYACFLNVNSVKDSPTMCSRRVFELLACRTPVVSTPSRAIDALLGDAVVTVDTEADARAAIERLVGDPDHRARVGHRGYRAVMAAHTYGRRVDDLLATVGIAAPPRRDTVAVIAATRRPDYLEHLLAGFAAQRGVDAELIVVTNSSRFDAPSVDAKVTAIGRAKAIHLPDEATLGECLNAALDATAARFVAKFDDDDHYGPEYLADTLAAFRYADAAIVGKKTIYVHLEGRDETVVRDAGNEFTYVNRVSGATIVIDRERWRDARFATLNSAVDADLCARARDAGLEIFSADRFNFVATRRAAKATHSWTIGDDEFLAGSQRIAPGLALDQAIV